MAKKKTTKKPTVHKTGTKPASKSALTPAAEKLRKEGIAIADTTLVGCHVVGVTPDRHG